MRLFHTLPEEQQDNAINYCLHMALHDVIDGVLKLEAVNEEETKLKEKFDVALEHIKTLTTLDEQMDYLMADEDISKALFEIGLELARTAFYREEDEFVIDMEDITNDDEEEKDEEETAKEVEAKKKLLN